MNPPPPIPAPEGEVPPRIFLRDVDLRDLDFDGAEGDVHATHSPRSIIITHSTPYVPESALLAEKQRGLRAVEEAKAEAEKYRALYETLRMPAENLIAKARASAFEEVVGWAKLCREQGHEMVGWSIIEGIWEAHKEMTQASRAAKESSNGQR